MTRYPRDMTGYGANPPAANWPERGQDRCPDCAELRRGRRKQHPARRCRVRGVLCQRSPARSLGPVSGTGTWNRSMNTAHAPGSGGFTGCWRLPVTVYGVATALARAPEQVAAMNGAGWEIASHGLKWIEHKDMPRPKSGRRSQRRSACTRSRRRGPARLVHRAAAPTTPCAGRRDRAVCYVADSYADDLPTGCELTAGPVDHALHDGLQRHAVRDSGRVHQRRSVRKLPQGQFRVLYEEGRGRCAQDAVIGLHCRLIGRPGRAALCGASLNISNPRRRLVRNAAADRRTLGQVSTHLPKIARLKWIATTFVTAFGGIFEHSPWIAEGAYDNELGPTHDTAKGVHQAVSRVFRTRAKRGVLAC